MPRIYKEALRNTQAQRRADWMNYKEMEKNGEISRCERRN